jgi:hypothetical protein
VAGLVALMALLLLPGLLLVRAPLLFVPALSASFWIVSAWWLPATVGRERFLRALVVSFGVLALVRLRDVRGGRPSAPALAVGVAAVLPLVLFFVGPALSGPRGTSFDSLSAALVVWNDGVPVSFQPLLDLQPFGAHAPAVATLSADVALLSGLAPSRAVLLVGLAAHALLVLALFGLARRRLAPPAAASIAILASTVAFLPRFVAPLGAATAVLALVLAATAALIVEGGDSRTRAAAAGLVLSAALLAHAVVGLVAGVFVVARLRPWRSLSGRSRVALAVGLSLVLAAPQLLRLARALSTRELVQSLGALWRPGGRSCPELPWIYQEEAAGGANPCALTSFDKGLGNPSPPDPY